jgi:hypothetical protein
MPAVKRTYHPLVRAASNSNNANQLNLLIVTIKYQANAVLHASTSSKTSNFYNLVKNNANAGPKNRKLQQRDANFACKATHGRHWKLLCTTYPSLCLMPHAPTLITKYNTPQARPLITGALVPPWACNAP